MFSGMSVGGSSSGMSAAPMNNYAGQNTMSFQGNPMQQQQSMGGYGNQNTTATSSQYNAGMMQVTPYGLGAQAPQQQQQQGYGMGGGFGMTGGMTGGMGGGMNNGMGGGMGGGGMGGGGMGGGMGNGMGGGGSMGGYGAGGFGGAPQGGGLAGPGQMLQIQASPYDPFGQQQQQRSGDKFDAFAGL
jgi:hypothetical protein